MDLVSVVVPVYNVEKYLERCVSSILNQSYRDIEIILVDDGSKDNSGEICDKLAQSDDRLKVIHKKNGGLSSARNAGLRIACGKYIGFVDSDDDIEVDMYAKMVEKIVAYETDFVMSDYTRVQRDSTRYLKTTSLQGGLYSKQKIETDIYPNLIMGKNLEYGPLLSVWHCLYRRDFLIDNNIYFDEEVRWSEDNIFSAIVGYKTNSFYYLKNEGLYHYYDNPGTITTGYRNGAWDVYCVMNKHLRQFFEKENSIDLFEEQLALHAIYYACNSIRQIPKCKKGNIYQYRLLKSILSSKILKEYFKNFRIPKEWNYKLRLQVLLMKYRCNILCLLMVK